MKYLRLTFVCTYVCLAQRILPQAPAQPFYRGEKIEYHLYVAGVRIAKANATLSKSFRSYAGKQVYHITLEGRTMGFLDVLIKVRDTWESYYDTTTYTPLYFSRRIREGGCRKYERTFFSYTNNKATVRTYESQKFKKVKQERHFALKPNTQDLLTSYYHLRLLNFNNLAAGDTVRINSFYEDSLYIFQIRYLGKERIKSSLGTFSSHVMSPIIPDNSLFEGENAVKLWISDDNNKIPLLLNVEMRNKMIGSVRVECVRAKELRYKLKSDY